MNKYKFVVAEEEAGMRVDKYVSVKIGEDYSRTYVKALIEKGLVLLNGDRIKPCNSIRENDEVFVEFIESPAFINNLEAENIPLKVVYEDEWVIVVDKPVGMVVHPGAGNKKGTLVSAVLYHCGSLPETTNKFRPGIVHRLDKDTSGVMVVAKNDRALRSLSKQFQNRTVTKKYLALVKGRVEIDNGIVEAPIARHPGDRKKMRVEFTEGKAAKTIYHVLGRFEGFTLLRLELLTGRTHQIRVHMQHLGHPVIGDVTYGARYGMNRQALHAESLGFTHPGTGKHVEFRSPMPDDIKFLVERKTLKEKKQ
ncbi:MAG: RluA family pseudouridine synthase [Candidatus Omnitrophota bacterium]